MHTTHRLPLRNEFPQHFRILFPSQNSIISRRRAGFTLVEILVAVTIFAVLTAGAMVSFRQFTARQQVIESSKDLQQAMRFAQKKARVGEKPSGCSTLQGYAVRGTPSSVTITMTAVCDNGQYLVTSFELKGEARLANNLDIIFRVITAGVTGVGAVRVQNSLFSFEFVVNAGGEVSEGAFVE